MMGRLKAGPMHEALRPQSFWHSASIWACATYPTTLVQVSMEFCPWMPFLEILPVHDKTVSVKVHDLSGKGEPLNPAPAFAEENSAIEETETPENKSRQTDGDANSWPVADHQLRTSTPHDTKGSYDGGRGGANTGDPGLANLASSRYPVELPVLAKVRKCCEFRQAGLVAPSQDVSNRRVAVRRQTLDEVEHLGCVSSRAKHNHCSDRAARTNSVDRAPPPNGH
mmetsp:Transcript_20987/g.61233  ORF Transcript_20987/g.61233 Transcript_20987/m.61233 type:complete len:225 (-) Transcript_20987:133-807(-)